MKKYYEKIKYLGVQKTDSHTNQRTTILLNELTFALVILQSFVYPEFLIKGEFFPVLITFIVQFFTGLPLVFSYFNKSGIGKWYFNTIMPLLMTVIIITHGQALRADYCYLIFAVTGALFFKKLNYKIFIFGVIIISYFFSLYYMQHYPAILIDHVTSWNASVVFIASLLCISIIVSRFAKEGYLYEKRIGEVLNNVQEKQREIQEQNTALTQANEDLSFYASMASHDLKSPLRNISSFIGLIKRKLKNYEDPDVKEYLNFVNTSANQMAYLIEDVLEYSKIGSADDDKQPVNLEDTLLKVKNNLRRFLEEKNAIILNDPLPIIEGYKTQVQLLMQNIIENGLKYNQSEVPTIQISYVNDEKWHCFTFKDNGIGIEETYFNRIFGMFKRLHNTTEYKGSGVGLAICKKIVARHKGEITLESTIGKGSSFIISLPK